LGASLRKDKTSKGMMKIINTVVSLFILIVAVSACQPYRNQQGRKYPSTPGTFNVTGNFTINPTTILDSLDHGKTNVFTSTVVTHTDDTSLPSGSVQWTQSDYLKVANALSQFVWNEPLDGWLIYFLSLENTCQDNLSGFDSFVAIYYKTIGSGWGKMYTARYIEIYPLASIVYWAGDTDFPISSGWAAIDLSKFKITADDALQIAEDNGGIEHRTRVHNYCNVSITLPTGKDDNRWDIAYYYSPSLEMVIDPYSGEYEILVRK
jgi:hypothetical protein